MPHLLLIDDDLDILPAPDPARLPRAGVPRGARDHGRAKGSNTSAPIRPTSSCSTSVCRTSPAWRSSDRSARSTPGSRSSSSPWPRLGGRRHRGDEAGRLRLPAQAARPEAAASGWSTRPFEIGRLMRVPAVLAETPDRRRPSGDAILGRCPAMQEVYKAIGRVAAQDVTVLIRGESGTGKELVARAIYQHSEPRRARRSWRSTAPRSPRPCWRASCSATRRAPSPGADRRRIGKFEQCNGGTLFLDEIGDMPLATQAKMLRRAAGAGVRARRRQRDDPDRRAADRGDEPRPEGGGRTRGGSAPTCTTASSVFTIAPAAAARAGRRPADAGPPLPAPVRPRAGAGGRRGRPRGDGPAARVLVAGQRARAAERAAAGAAARCGARSCSPSSCPSSRRTRDRIGVGRRFGRGRPRPRPGIVHPAGARRGHRQPARARRTGGWTGSSCRMVLEHTQGNQRQAAEILGIARQDAAGQAARAGHHRPALLGPRRRRRGVSGAAAVSAAGQNRAGVASRRPRGGQPGATPPAASQALPPNAHPTSNLWLIRSVARETHSCTGRLG